MEQIIAILIVVFLIVSYILLYLLNHRTPIPKECEDIVISTSNCSSCKNSGCGVKTRVSKKGGNV